MKRLPLKHTYVRLVPILILIIFLFQIPSNAQEKIATGQTYNLSLQDAITLSKAHNKLVQAAITEEQATDADLKDAKNAALPVISANADYQRFTNLTLYNGFFGNARSVPRQPSQNGVDAGFSSEFSIYAGGRQKALVITQSLRKELSGINTKDETGNISLQVAAQYLNMVGLTDLKRFTDEQVVRAETRLKNIIALYKNQKVTRSDVLRAEVNLSTIKLNLEQTENDLTISNLKLDVLMNLPDSTLVVPTDSANMSRPLAETLLYLLAGTGTSAYAILKAEESIKIQKQYINEIRSNNAPSLSLYSAYGLSYPNYIFYPPVDQAHSIGFIGFKIQYNISSIYQNKHKVSSAGLRLQELQLQQQSVSDDVRQQAGALLIKYREALNRISVDEGSIEQARVNYKIVSAKYYNQLALLTDLLDADNLYQESRFNLVQALTRIQFIYYNLLYTSGKL